MLPSPRRPISIPVKSRPSGSCCTTTTSKSAFWRRPLYWESAIPSALNCCTPNEKHGTGGTWPKRARATTAGLPWIVGAKFFVLLNSHGQIVNWNCCPASRHDTIFHRVIEKYQEQMIVLADSGFHARSGDPLNPKLCQRGAWKERMLIETTFSLFAGTMRLKKLTSRLSSTLRARLGYIAAAYNLCTSWSGGVKLELTPFAL